MNAVTPTIGNLVYFNGITGPTLCRISEAKPDSVLAHWLLTLKVEKHSSNKGSCYDAGDLIFTTEVRAIPYNMLKRDRRHIRPFVWTKPV